MKKEHPFAYLRKRADVLKCCGMPKNLHVTAPMKGVLLARCKVCGRKHRKMQADPGSLFARGLEAMAARVNPRKLILPGDVEFKI